MLIPRFWSRADSQATTPDGKRIEFHLWRGARGSLAEAEAAAAEAARRMAARISQGQGFPERYTYGDRPLREEVVRELPAGAGAEGPDAALTRNSYGALVLNAARVFFIDVDHGTGGEDEPAAREQAGSPGGAPDLWGMAEKLLGKQTTDAVPPQVRSVLKGIFGGSRSEPAAPAPTPPPAAPQGGRGAASIATLRQWLTSHPDWRVRVYRTHSGLRYLVTHALFGPNEADAQQTMRALGADPQYIQLCSAQKSFRARLTPKPWRIGMETPPVRFPYESPADERAMRDWEARYNAASSGYATCEFVEELGGGTEHPEVAPLRALHDEHARATSGLPLG